MYHIAVRIPSNGFDVPLQTPSASAIEGSSAAPAIHGNNAGAPCVARIRNPAPAPNTTASTNPASQKLTRQNPRRRKQQRSRPESRFARAHPRPHQHQPKPRSSKQLLPSRRQRRRSLRDQQSRSDRVPPPMQSLHSELQLGYKQSRKRAAAISSGQRSQLRRRNSRRSKRPGNFD